MKKIYANKEVILSGGSINSPQLLMLSGIGDADNLKDKGIEIVNDIKGVEKICKITLKLIFNKNAKHQTLCILIQSLFRKF